MGRIDQVQLWLKEGEHEQLDFKLRINDATKIARTLVAFANHKGGIILSGISDFGEVTGIDPIQEEFVLRKALRNYCRPTIQTRFEVYRSEGKLLLACVVKKGKGGPFRAYNEQGDWLIYKRKNDQCVVISETNETGLADNSPIPIISGNELGLIDYLQANMTITVRQFMSLAKLDYNTSMNVLQRLATGGILASHQTQKELYFTLRKKE